MAIIQPRELREPFSKQYRTPKEIAIREDAPPLLRHFVLQTAREELKWSVYDIRAVICRVLRVIPNEYERGSDFYMWEEAKEWMYGCEWFQVYDVIEALYGRFERYDSEEYGRHFAERFTDEINRFFVDQGIGWQLVNGQIITRGDEGFQGAVKTADFQLNDNQRPTAASHIRFAFRALSERPTPNTSGAVAQATSAVECVLHDITGHEMTLGKYLDKHPGLFHPALRKALDGVYGYASDAGARHGKEGREPSFDEAQFAVTTCAAACSLLTAMNPKLIAR